MNQENTKTEATVVKTSGIVRNTNPLKPILFIAHREVASMFYSPIAYVVICVFALLSGLFFVSNVFNTPGAQAEMSEPFYMMIWVLIATLPGISMRLMSEELRAGTFEPLLSTPIKDYQVILGKWIGAMVFYLVMLTPSFVHVIILETFASPDYGPIFTGYLGLYLVGGFYLAIGMFASVLTKNQIIAYLVSVFIILLFTLVMFFIYESLPSDYVIWASYTNVMQQFGDFNKGLIDTKRIVIFLSGIGFFLLLANVALESRRWR